MTKLPWRLMKQNERMRDRGIRVQRWNSRAQRAGAYAFVWNHGSSIEDLRAENIGEVYRYIRDFLAHGIAEGSHSAPCERWAHSSDAQSEPDATNRQNIRVYEATVVHLLSLVDAHAFHAEWPWQEWAATGHGHLESSHTRIPENRHRIPLLYEEHSAELTPASTEKPAALPSEQEDAEPESRCSAIIAALQRSDHQGEKRRVMILESEVLPFQGQQAAALVPFLKQFIEENRESNVPADRVAVGSAIRNYIATAPTNEAFELAANLLTADGRPPIPIELEVEVSKMVVRKLTANPPVGQGLHMELASRLLELADTYLNPRLLAREKYGAVALNTVLGCVLTRDSRAAEVVDRVRTLGVSWFRQLVARQAAQVASDLRRRWPDERNSELVGSLEELVFVASAVSSK
jgi:hypothetical protein